MKIIEFLKDDTGALSSQRLVFIMGFFSFLAMWIVQSIHEMKVSPIDNSVLYFLVMIMTSKIGQSITENIKPPQLKG